MNHLKLRNDLLILKPIKASISDISPGVTIAVSILPGPADAPSPARSPCRPPRAGCSGAAGPRTGLVFARSDYEDFQAKKKYLSAKLLTFFAEHPLFFFGYSAEDPNIRAILADIDEILSPDGQLIPNIYLVEWNPQSERLTSFPSEKLIAIDADRSVRVKNIVSSGFQWVFDSLGSNEALPSVSPKILRALMARTYSLVRHDIPKRTVEVDYDTLQHAVSSEQELAKLYGITTLDDPSAVNAMYPFSLSHVGHELGYASWHQAI